MKKHVLLLVLLFPVLAAEAQNAVVFKSVTVDGLGLGDTKRLVRGGLPVCGYYSKTDSLFYSCSQDNPMKIDPKNLKDGAGCCGSITFGRSATYKQYFSISGALEEVDSIKGEFRLKKGDRSYFVQLENPASIKTLAPAMASHPDQLTFRLKNF